VYRRDVAPERHLGIFALYVVYYPQLVAGPIERAFHFLPQLRLLRTPDPKLAYDETRAVDGLRLVLRGFVKKIIVADNLALFVDPIYNAPANATGTALFVATIAFAFQIYFDFSAYTDIARGCSRVMGLELVHNFRRPYLARSVADFWKRWHISLTSWFRDYVYLPMGGNRVAHGRWIVNVMTVFLLSGVWHGANWTFVVWGALHGGYYIVSRNTALLRAAIASKTCLSNYPTLHAGLADLADVRPRLLCVDIFPRRRRYDRGRDHRFDRQRLLQRHSSIAGRPRTDGRRGDERSVLPRPAILFCRRDGCAFHHVGLAKRVRRSWR